MEIIDTVTVTPAVLSSPPSAKWGVHIYVKYAKYGLVHILHISLHIFAYFYCIFLHILYREVHISTYLRIFYCIFLHIKCRFIHIFAYVFAYFDIYAHIFAYLFCIFLHMFAYCLSGSPYFYIFVHICHAYFGIYLYMKCIFKHVHTYFM